jgi:hypothetical protein
MSEFWTNNFSRDLNEGDINFCDNLQFELKSSFPLSQTGKKTLFLQEFFLFVPSALYINRLSYPKSFFYQDELTLIRYKTPVYTFLDLIQSDTSPLHVLKKSPSEKEIKLLANVFRSTLRSTVREFLSDTEKNEKKLSRIARHIEEFTDQFLKLKSFLPKQLHLPFTHAHEFILQSIEYYICGLLEMCPKDLHTEMFFKLLAKNQEAQKEIAPLKKKESILHRHSILTKYIMDVLQLKSTRIAVQEKHGAAFGALAAGIAMFLYTTLFAITFLSHTSNPFLTTSFPVILTIVLLYILKDRVKEGLKSLYQNRAGHFFPDYRTDILDPSGNKIGVLKETLEFLKREQLPEEIINIRERDFHQELKDIKRFETVIKYKREVILLAPDKKSDPRLKDINILFRFNVHHLIEKASDTLPVYLSFNREKNTIEKINLPKLYHLNLVIRSNHTTPEKYRVLVDKSGIKGIEKL